jgi:hypothetical protein
MTLSMLLNHKAEHGPAKQENQHEDYSEAAEGPPIEPPIGCVIIEEHAEHHNENENHPEQKTFWHLTSPLLVLLVLLVLLSVYHSLLLRVLIVQALGESRRLFVLRIASQVRQPPRHRRVEL